MYVLLTYAIVAVHFFHTIRHYILHGDTIGRSCPS